MKTIPNTRRFGRWIKPEPEADRAGGDGMLCPKCGYYAESEENVCPACGEILRHESGFCQQGAQAIRQGKRAREAARTRPLQDEKLIQETRRRRSGASHATVEMPAVQDTRSSGEAFLDGYTISEDPEEDEAQKTFERRKRIIYDDEADAEQAARYLAAHDGNKRYHHSMVNWMKVVIITFGIILLIAIGSFAFVKWTDAGQRILARIWVRFPKLNVEISSASLWAVGDEMMDDGQIDDAILCFERAKAQDEKEKLVDVDGLLMLGNAYEASGQMKEAALLYESIYTETPSRSEAYIAHIRILTNSGEPGDSVKAGELMKTAYEKTGEATFLSQRSDLLPAPPEVNLTAGYYETKKTISILSYQGYDVYYTFDENAELPYGGIKFTTPIPLEEGTHNLRAVAVNGELVSDELRGTYKIIMPSPQTPQCNLAPMTYKTSQKVRLKPGKDNINDDDIIIYYTVDGSNPDADSPIYNGTPVQLANGRVTLKAVAVNKYRKVSNMLEVNYKIEAKPQPKSAFTTDDMIDKLKPGTTTQLEFQEKYGEGISSGAVNVDGFDTECRRYDYPWGYAIMNLTRKTWILVEVEYHSSGVFSAPRGTNIGDPEKNVTNQFRDMLQLESNSGNRGLYSNDYGSGKIWKQDDGSKIIRYRYTYENHWLQLDYHVSTAGTVDSIHLKYIP